MMSNLSNHDIIKYYLAEFEIFYQNYWSLFAI